MEQEMGLLVEEAEGGLNDMFDTRAAARVDLVGTIGRIAGEFAEALEEPVSEQGGLLAGFLAAKAVLVGEPVPYSETTPAQVWYLAYDTVADVTDVAQPAGRTEQLAEIAELAELQWMESTAEGKELELVTGFAVALQMACRLAA